MAEVDLTKLTKLEALKQFAERVNDDFATKDSLNAVDAKVTKLQGDVTNLEGQLGDENVIESIEVNGDAQQIDDKTVNIKVPTKTSDLDNDDNFQDENEVKALVTAGIDKFASDLSENGKVDTFAELVNYVAEHGTQVTGILADILQNANDIDALEKLVGDATVAKQISDALAGYYSKSDIDSKFVIASDEEVELMLDEVFGVSED